MDKKKFLQEITKVAEWVYPQVTIDGKGNERLGLARRGNTRDENWVTTEYMGPRIINFKSKTPCNWCPSVDPKVNYRKHLADNSWHAYCQTCGYYVDPHTGQRARTADKLKK